MRLRFMAVAAAASVLLVGSCSDAPNARDRPFEKPAATWSLNIDDASSAVPVDTLIEASVQNGEITDASLTSADGETTIDGEGGANGWTATQRLEPGTTYAFRGTARGADGEDVAIDQSFSTADLSLDQQTYPSVAPLEGETVGVGMPVIVTFDIPVENKALFEQNMHVSTEPEVEGSWYWLSDSVAHYRPENYWPAGTKVTVDVEVNSLPAGNGVFGQQDQHVPFTVGSEVVTTVDVAKHSLSMSIDGQVQRTIPVSTGKPGHETRGGTKVIMEKFSSVDMDAASTGVSEDDADYYNISDVRWAMRVTNSGEFLHAAPWSVGSQGRENVSHGCVGMSTADAKWIYDRSKRGDIVTFINSGRPLEQHNGWTDWNIDWDTWLEGSALDEDAQAS